MNSSDIDTLSRAPNKTASQPADIESLVRSLRQLLEGDQQEQKETFEYLRRSLEEDRASTRRLFK